MSDEVVFTRDPDRYWSTRFHRLHCRISGEKADAWANSFRIFLGVLGQIRVFVCILLYYYFRKCVILVPKGGLDEDIPKNWSYMGITHRFYLCGIIVSFFLVYNAALGKL